jgi:hypothetical protein
MAERTVLLSIDGPLDAMDPRALSVAVDGLVTLISQVSTDSAAWTLADLRASSLHVELRGPSDEADLVEHGLAVLAGEARIPDGWPIEAVQALAKWDSVRRMRGVQGISVKIDDQVNAIDDVLLSHARASIRPGPPSLGAVTGELFRYNHLELTAGVKDPVRGESITVRFPATMARRFRELLTLRVRVWGEVQRNAAGKRVEVVAERIDPVEPRRGVPHA